MTDPLSLFVYGAGQLFPVVFLLAFWQARERVGPIFYLLAFAPLCLFAALRGPSVGTDTEAYLGYFDTLDQSGWIGLDPMFFGLQWVVKGIGASSQWFLVLQAAFCWVAFSFGASHADRRLPVLGVGMLPVLLLDSTFNGMRYGMAFATTLLVLDSLEAKEEFWGDVAAFVPGLFHSSLWILLAARARLLGLVAVALGILVYAGSLDSLGGLGPLIEWKVIEYSDIQRPEWYSGLMPLFQASILLYLSRAMKCGFKLGINLPTVAMAVILFAIPVMYVSYAALRIIQLGVFLFAASVSRAAKETNGWTELAVVALGVTGVLNFWRQIFVAGQDAGVMFVPYRFFFQ